MKIDQPTKMRDGSVADDPRLGRLFEQDPKSREYDVAPLLEQAEAPVLGPVSKAWYTHLRLDQARTAACTGNARIGDLAASPIPLHRPDGKPFTEDDAQNLYHLAQKYDEWPGENYEGSSVLGACKAAQALGYIGEYRWAFNMDDMILALGHVGPVVVGTTWLDAMFDPRSSGLLEVNGSDAGGHSYMFRRVIVTHAGMRRLLGKGEPIREQDALLGGVNSWGTSWGKTGEFYMWASDYENNLYQGGDQSIVTSPFHR